MFGEGREVFACGPGMSMGPLRKRHRAKAYGGALEFAVTAPSFVDALRDDIMVT
jgi:hypothetical protein